jgi:NDP-sugar pyrophosphorylase family protein
MSLPPVAVLAGGLATRLRPITEKIPKSLVEVAGAPFLAHQLRLLRRRGVSKAVLLIGHLGDRIEQFAGDGSAFGLVITYSDDGEMQRGTGGAVRNALPLLGPSFFVTYGDAYLDVPLEPLVAAQQATRCPAVMAVHHNKDRWDASNVSFDGSMVLRHEKTARGSPGVEWIDYGLSLFTAEAIASWPAPDPFDLTDLTAALAREGKLAGVEVWKRFYEIGKPEGLAETEAYLRSSGRC